MKDQDITQDAAHLIQIFILEKLSEKAEFLILNFICSET